jgi:predicted metal-dependent hydrolase
MVDGLVWAGGAAAVSADGGLVAHGLVHLPHEDHGRAFWATLGRAMPDHEERKRRLRAMGPRLVW